MIKGGIEGLYKLASCYADGIGTEQSLEKAAYYYKLAAENGYKACYNSAGWCYYSLSLCNQGTDTKKMLEKALFCFKQGACAGYLPSQRTLIQLEKMLKTQI